MGGGREEVRDGGRKGGSEGWGEEGREGRKGGRNKERSHPTCSGVTEGSCTSLKLISLASSP